MLKRLALVAVLAGLMPALAAAHGPTRQKVLESIEINAPADKVWSIVGKFQDMGWTGAFTKTEGTGDNTPNATRTLTLPGGATIEEKLIKYNNADKTYSYEVTAVDVKVVPVTNYSSTISVKGDNSKATVEWKGAFYRGYTQNDPPPELNDEAAVKAVTNLYKTSLATLKGKLEAGER